MKRTFWIACLLLTAALAAAETPSDQAAPAAQAFERFKELAGKWEGKDSQGGKVRINYEVVADGSAVLERLFVEGRGRNHDMATLIHLDGDRLLLTHYCVAKNQPRMEAKKIDPSGGQVLFEFVDATNLPSPETGHMHRANYRFEGPDRLATDWTWWENGQEDHTRIVDIRRTDGM